jgi:hypothetical protein
VIRLPIVKVPQIKNFAFFSECQLFSKKAYDYSISVRISFFIICNHVSIGMSFVKQTSKNQIMRTTSKKTMKLTCFFIAFLAIQVSTFGQEEQTFRTIFDNNETLRISGFGGPIIEFSSVVNEFAVSSGGGGGVIINNFFIGGYGIGLSSNHFKDISYVHPTSSSGLPFIYSNERINFGHGGFWLGGSLKPNEAIHLAYSTKLGWGSINMIEEDNSKYLLYHFTDNVFVIQPQIEAEMNITRWFKVNFGLGYRFVTGIDEKVLDVGSPGGMAQWKQFFKTKDFNSLTGTVSLLFGGF